MAKARPFSYYNAARTGFGVAKKVYRSFRKATKRQARRAGSSSHTKTRTTQLRDTIDLQKEASRTHTTINLRKSRHHRNAGGSFSFLFQSQGTCVTPNGKQGVFEIAYHGHISDQLIRATTKPPHAAPLQNIWSTNPFDLNPYRAITGSQLIPAAVDPQNDRILFKSVYTEVMLVNESVGPVYIDLYWLTPRTIIEEGPANTWVNMLSYTGMQSGPAVQSVTFGAAMTIGVSHPSIYGEHPGYCKPFFRTWRPLRKKRLIMQAGATHKQSYTINFNKMLDKPSLLRSAAGNSPFILGTTVYLMAVIRPAPALIREGTNVTLNNKGWTTMQNVTGFVTTQRYTFQSIGTNRLETNIAEPTFVAEVGDTGVGYYEIIRDVADDLIAADKP